MFWRAALLAASLAVPAAAEATQCRAVIPPKSCAGGLTVAAIGDVMAHEVIQTYGYAQPDGFRAIWGMAEPFLRGADIALANLETPLAAGVNSGGGAAPDPDPVLDRDVYGGFPTFNAHPVLAVQLKTAGIDAVSTANNHALDRGPLGVDRTIDALTAAGLAHAGTVRQGTPRQFVTHLGSPAGPVALIACTEMVNDRPDPYRQTLRCHRDRAELLAMIRREAERSAAVLVMPHWGTEYSHTPTRRQKDLARAMAAAGATAILGAHPHVIQPWDWLPGLRGKALVAYSLGNFISAQLQSTATRAGALAWLELCPAAGALTVARTGWIPLMIHRTPSGPWLSAVSTAATGGEAQGRRLAARVLPPQTAPLDMTCTAGSR